MRKLTVTMFFREEDEEKVETAVDAVFPELLGLTRSLNCHFSDATDDEVKNYDFGMDKGRLRWL